jgi:lysozyme
MADSVICVDLSHYQAGFDFQSFKSGGGLGVILKATEGLSITDRSHAIFRAQALAAGLAVASYHFLHPGDIAAQAEFFLGAVNPRRSERVVVDHERPPEQQPAPSLGDLIAFLQAIQSARPDLQLTVYSGDLIKEQLGSTRNEWLAENTSLWLADFTAGEPEWPRATWPAWSLWQYTDAGAVPGFGGGLDCDRFNGTEENFLKWIGPPSPAAAAAPKPAPRPEAVRIAMTIEADGPIALTINGVPVDIPPLS